MSLYLIISDESGEVLRKVRLWTGDFMPQDEAIEQILNCLHFDIDHEDEEES